MSAERPLSEATIAAIDAASDARAAEAPPLTPEQIAGLLWITRRHPVGRHRRRRSPAA